MRATYDVTVKGEVGPVMCASLQRHCSVETSHSARLVVRCPTDYDLMTLHALLEERGLSVVCIRPLVIRDQAAASP